MLVCGCHFFKLAVPCSAALLQTSGYTLQFYFYLPVFISKIQLSNNQCKQYCTTCLPENQGKRKKKKSPL